jgi:uncharacterized protein
VKRVRPPEWYDQSGDVVEKHQQPVEREREHDRLAGDPEAEEELAHAEEQQHDHDWRSQDTRRHHAVNGQRTGVWTWIALTVSLAGAPFLVLLSRWAVGDFPRLSIQIVLQSLYCGMAVFVLWVVRARERLSFESIGLRRPDLATLLWAVLLFGAMQALSLVTTPLARRLGTNGLDEGLQLLRASPPWFRIVLALTGGVVEETLYRGYAIERLSAIVRRRWLAGAISALVFGLAHVPYWGIGMSLAGDLPFGMLMTVSYLWRRHLAANMLAHSAGLVLAMVTVV